MRGKSKTFIMLIIAMIFNSCGDVLLSRTMKSVGEVAVSDLSEALDIAARIFSIPTFWASIGFFFVFFLLWMTLMKMEDLSFIIPLSAISYIITAFMVGPLLGETLTWQRWGGIAIIAAGVALVAASAEGGKNS